MNTRIKLLADQESLETAGGQTALVASFISLAQMGLRITLDVPDVPIIGVQPPLDGPTIRSALISHAEQLIQPCAQDLEYELVLAIGSGDPGELGYRLTSDGSTTAAQMGNGPECWQGDDPVSGAMAGVLAGAAALPVAVRQLERALDRRAPAHLRTLKQRIAVSLPRISPKTGEIGDVEVVSAGAITNATVFVLLRSDLKGQLRIFDDDRFEVTNLNRYALLRRSDVGRPKVSRSRTSPHIRSRFPGSR